MKKNIKLMMPPKSIVVNELSDIGVSNDLYYSRNLLARFIFRSRIKYALNIAQPSNKVILDVGCGAGFLSYNLSANGAQTIACDLRTKLSKSNKVFNSYLSNSKKIQFSNADIFSLPFKSNSFDIVCALDMLEHLDNVEMALIEIKRVLVDDGHLIVSIPNENIFYRFGRKIVGIKKANHIHNSSELVRLLNTFFYENATVSVTQFRLFFISRYVNMFDSV